MMRAPCPGSTLVRFRAGRRGERCEVVSGSLIIRGQRDQGFLGHAHFCARFNARAVLHSDARGPMGPANNLTDPITCGGNGLAKRAARYLTALAPAAEATPSC
jgi:hypothetical protein